ncbi:hypothetical protein HYS28_01185 [Candidatus Uhrbacteria bacterium]|nr:hypothetical protein [Candidatus Uhrbacteria bacterium]
MTDEIPEPIPNMLCPVCGERCENEKCKVICRSEKCTYRIVMNCSEFDG